MPWNEARRIGGYHCGPHTRLQDMTCEKNRWNACVSRKATCNSKPVPWNSTCPCHVQYGTVVRTVHHDSAGNPG